jgi:Skp family chaperone for outer membrane proteins
MTKNISLILNAILLLLVANLYFKVYSSPKPAEPTPSVASTDTSKTERAIRIAYVNADTILDKLTSFKSEKASLEKFYQDRAASLQGKMRQLQTNYAALQEKAQKGTVPPATLQAEAQQLQQQEQELGQQQAKSEKELAEKIQTLNENLQKRVIGQLEKLKAERGFDWVFSYTKVGSPFLIVDGKTNVTTEVLQALNNEKK